MKSISVRSKVLWLVVVITATLMSIVCFAGESKAGEGSSPIPIWQFNSKANISTVRPKLDGGAFIATTWTNGGISFPGSNTIYSIKSDETISWSHVGDEGQRLSLKDVTPDGKIVLAAVTPKVDSKLMKLLMLSSTGEIIKESKLLEKSNWVWLSPNGKLLLRRINSDKSMLLEELISGQNQWSLHSRQTPVTVEESGFVQPIWQAGCILIGNPKQGVEAISLKGKGLWRWKNLHWRMPGNSPIIASPSGEWLVAKTAQATTIQGSPGNNDIEHLTYDSGGLGLSELKDKLELLHITMNPDFPNEQFQSSIVWQRTVISTLVTELQHPPRTNPETGGAVLDLDLFERHEQGKYLPSLTVLTDTALVTLVFDESGNLKEEIPWYVPNIAGVFEAWLLPSGRMLIKRPNTKGTPQAVQIIDRMGNVLWEIKPSVPIQSISFDANRRFMIVNMINLVECYRLER